VTGATDAQVKATESYITKAQLAYGINDNDLRPSLDRLVRSTKDVEEAQKLQTLAINIAAGTGKSLQAVSEALAKAHDGNFTALKKLGGGIDENIIKSKNFEAATASLADTFEGQASKQADTFDGKMRRLKEAFGEGKESIGGFILDAVTPMVSTIVDKVVPAVQSFIDGIGGEKGIGNALKTYIGIAKSIFIPVFEGIKFAFDNIKAAVEGNKESFQALFTFLSKYVAPFLGESLKLAIQGIALALRAVLNIVGDVIDAFRTLISLGSKIGGSIGNLFGGGKATGGPVAGGTTYLVGEKGPELFTPSGNGTIIPNGSFGGGASNVINITVNGAIDPISTARQITQILNREATLSGTFNKVGASLLVGA
jgi:phage-related minor tail protein